MRAIELRLVDEGASLAAERRAEPFARYAADIADAFGRGPITLEAWRSFLLSRYWGAPEACRVRARKYPLSPIWTRIESGLIEHQRVAYIALALATLVVTVVGVIRH
jgi:hypothetical protein